MENSKFSFVQHNNKNYKALYCKHCDCKMCEFWNIHKLYSKTLTFSSVHCYICHYISNIEDTDNSYNFIYNDNKMVAKLLCNDCFENNKNLSKTSLSNNLNSIILKYIHLDDQFTSQSIGSHIF